MRFPLTLLTALLATILLAPAAWATAQTPERIFIDGKEHPLYSTPLAPLVEGRKKLFDTQDRMSTDLWRGYRGVWRLEDGMLLLARLERLAPHDHPDENRFEPLPWTPLFGDRKGPIPATWFTGTLRIAISGGGRYVHMGFGSTAERERVMEIRRGKVISNRIVDRSQSGRGISELDRRHVALADAAHTRRRNPDDRTWVDARTLTGEIEDRVPAGTPFVTRGILHVEDEDGSLVLWIPETEATPAVRRRIHLEGKIPGGTWPHVELEATWHKREGSGVLHVAWLRRLPPGLSIHHPDFPVPPPAPSASPSLDRPLRGHPIHEAGRVYGVAARYYVCELHGVLPLEGRAEILGVEVADVPALRGKAVRVLGYVERWEITPRLLERDPPAIAPLKDRGVGTWLRLVDPRTGALAVPVATEAPDAK